MLMKILLHLRTLALPGRTLALAGALLAPVGAAQAQTPATFTAASTYASGGTEPFAMALGDVNTDGRPDIVVANTNSNNVGVLLNTTLVAAPTIASLSPTSGPMGTSVTLTGTGLTGVTGVSFNGTAATVFSAGTGSTATATVPTGATTGNVTVTTTGGTSNGLAFTVSTPPTITAISPTANAVASATTSPVAVTFSQPLDASSGPALKVFSSLRGGLRTAAVPATVSGNSLTFTPSAYGFQPGERVFSTVTTAATAGGAALATPYVFEFTTATTPGSGTFAPKTDYTTGVYPNAVTLGDVNNDGVLDMATANDGGTASVLLGLSAGGFGARVEYPTGSYPTGVALGDVNGDGKLDLVTSNSGDVTISVLLGTGTGTFGAKTDYSTQDEPYGLALGDVNGDGRLDIVTANINFSTASVLLGTGTGSFGAPALFATNYSPVSVALGDVNGDGKLDMVTGNLFISSGPRVVSVLLGTGTGSFGPKTDYPIGTGTNDIFGVALGDLNGDGRLDLVATNTGNSSNSSTSVLLGTGSGTFGPKTDYPTGGTPYSVALGDLNGDGRIDIITANITANSVSVLVGTGTGTFASRVDYATGPNPANAVFGDVNQDGRLDIVTANAGNGTGTTASVLLGLATAPTLVSFTPSSGPGGTSVVLTGTGFTGATAVAFNGTAAPGFMVNSPTQITVSVPTGASTGTISVTTPGGTATSAGAFTVVVTCATITVAVTPAGPVNLPSGGSQVLTATATTPGFNAGGSGLDATSSNFVRKVVAQPDGKLLVAGEYTTYNGAPARSLVRLNADGTRDAAFNSSDGFAANFGAATAVAVLPSGKVLVGGRFSQFNGATVPRNLLLLNPDGTLDATFNSGNTGFTSSDIQSLTVQPDGKLIIGGDFLTHNGSAVPRGLIRLNADGTRDVTFNAGGAGFSGSSSVIVRNVVLQPDGRLVVVGQYTAYNGVAAGAIVRLNADGSRDATFNAGGSGFNNVAEAVALQSDGKLLVGGNSTTYNGVGVPGCLIRLNADGTRDASFNGTNPGLNNYVLTLALQPDGKVVAGGFFSTFNSGTVPSCFARFNADGSSDAGFNGGNTGFSPGAGAGGSVRSVALQADGKIVAVGYFTAYNGAATPVAIACVNADGTLNNANTPVPGATFVFNPGNTTGATRTVTTAGSYTATATDPATGCTYVSNTVVVNATPADLTVSTGTLASPASIPAGTYNSITVTGTGNGILAGDVVVNGALVVQNGGSLADGCNIVTGTGTFTLAAGGTLSICRPRGILAVGDPQGNIGLVRVTGGRSFASDASYIYAGSDATGSGLPSQVRNLSITVPGNVALSAPTSITQVLTLSSAGNLVLGGNGLTLLSSASGTAVVVNSSTGVVNGTATVQRFISSANTGLGYRHYSSPVANTTVGDLATAGFSPVLTASYNNSATPGTTTPFPTVFGYDQSRVTLTNAYAPFDRGYVVPAAASTVLATGQGYAVNLAGTELVDFNGTLNNGTLPLALSRLAGNTDAGWQLLGNPYPAPLDYSLVAPADRANFDGAIYVYSSTGQYVGNYRAYINGIGGNPVLPVAQGFFARVSIGQTSGSLIFRNSQRLTAPDATAFQRTAADPRPLVQLELRGSTGPADALYAYAQTGATPAFDSQFDAAKLANPTGLNLSSTVTSGEILSIDGRPAFTATTVLPLAVGVPAAGSYTLTAAVLANLPTGLDAYLRDAQTGQTVNLRTQPAYSFTVTAAQATALLVGRFTLQFSAAALATTVGLTAAKVSLFPNPAHHAFVVQLPGVAGVATVQAELLNALGQVVRRQSAALPANGVTLPIDATGLAAGVYTLRLQAGTTVLAKRVILN